MLDKLKLTIHTVVANLDNLSKEPEAPVDLVTVADMLFWVVQANLDSQGVRRGMVEVIKLALTDLDSCWDWAASHGLSAIAKCITVNKDILQAALYESYDW